ncbi:MAG: nitric oxide reductase transcriptional regulator NorR [Burkholderiaceae bacterium]
MLTQPAFVDAFLPLLRDLSRDLPPAERYRRLLEAVRRLFQCDACALLQLDGDALLPRAVSGLGEDVLGRRFRIAEHPRFAALMASDRPTCFDARSKLPDPYDGLVNGMASDALTVHDCMGCPLSVDGRPWGLLTLDALVPGRFASIDPREIQTFASLAAATVSAAERIVGLSNALEEQRTRADGYRHAADARAARAPIGRSPAFRRLLDELRVVADSELTVLIKGETGTGKELVAQAIHAASPRAERPLITINCAALPETLVESELFGHVRGAFSGATADRKGKFELAHGGTLFLDEVGELPLPAQAKLLRVMQSGQLQRVGSDREHHADVRVIAASNRDLAEEVRQGRCRADFYHRLSVYPLRVPPLRERGHDVLLLAGAFLEENRARLALGGLRLAADARDALLRHDWPGNVRELEHLVARSALKALSAQPAKPRVLTITAADLGLDGAAPPVPLPPRQAPASPATFAVEATTMRAAVESLERRLIEEGLERHAGNWAATARELGLDRANLARMARRLGLRASTA